MNTKWSISLPHVRGHVHVVWVYGLLLLGLFPLCRHLHPGELAGPIVLAKGLHLEDVLSTVVPKVLYFKGKIQH